MSVKHPVTPLYADEAADVRQACSPGPAKASKDREAEVAAHRAVDGAKRARRTGAGLLAAGCAPEGNAYTAVRSARRN